MAPTETETEVDTETTKKAVAEHTLLDANGKPVDNEEDATGYEYKLLENGESWTWQFADANEAEIRMFVIFGVKTFATNYASQIRNNVKLKGTKEGNADAQIAFVRERAAQVRSGVWLDRSGERAPPRIDKDKHAEAICIVLVANNKFTQAQIDQFHKAAVRQRLDDEPAYLAKTRKVPEVAQEYSRLVGRATATVDDLM